VYTSKDGKSLKTFDALEWLAATCSHVPNKREMRIIALIEKQEVTKKILKPLGLWEVKPRPPPRIAKTQPLCTKPPSIAIPSAPAGRAYAPLTHKGGSPYNPAHLKRVLITLPPHLNYV
jgi:hypothetical protein